MAMKSSISKLEHISFYTMSLSSVPANIVKYYLTANVFVHCGSSNTIGHNTQNNPPH
jgi:hypothetical protein